MKHMNKIQKSLLAGASPPGNGGRGLKPKMHLGIIKHGVHRPPATGGVD